MPHSSGSKTPDREPAQPRKLPRQQRSIALVTALKEATLLIVSREGSEALTVARLSEVSGVAIGSIYEYFPSIDAIITAVFEDYLHTLLNRSNTEMELLPPTAGLHDALGVMVRQSLDIRQHLSALHLDFYRRHIDYFEVIRVLGQETNAASAFQRSRRRLDRFRDEIRNGDPDKIFFLFVRALQFVTRAIVLEHSDYLRQPDTAEILTDMLYGLLSGRSDVRAS